MHEKIQNAFESLRERFGYNNRLQAPRVLKVVASVGVGSERDKGKLDVVLSRLAKITGQKPAPRGAKKSIASFKTREGDVVGYQVTLRGKRMEGFLEKLFNVALPRTRDFRGIPQKSLDEMGNLTIGIPEHIIFPETSDEELRDVFGLAVTIVSTAKNREEARAFFEHIGVPFAKK